MKKVNKGFSLLEMLVVIMIFSVLGILVSRSVLLTLRGSKKSENAVSVRENLNYAMNIVERQLRNANEVSPCSGVDPSVINYTDTLGKASSFSCAGIGGEDAHIASGSGRLTNSSVLVTTCSFICTPSDTAGLPSLVEVIFAGENKDAQGTENSRVTVSNKIYLRNY